MSSNELDWESFVDNNGVLFNDEKPVMDHIIKHDTDYQIDQIIEENYEESCNYSDENLSNHKGFVAERSEQNFSSVSDKFMLFGNRYERDIACGDIFPMLRSEKFEEKLSKKWLPTTTATSTQLLVLNDNLKIPISRIISPPPPAMLHQSNFINFLQMTCENDPAITQTSQMRTENPKLLRADQECQLAAALLNGDGVYEKGGDINGKLQINAEVEKLVESKKRNPPSSSNTKLWPRESKTFYRVVPMKELKIGNKQMGGLKPVVLDSVSSERLEKCNVKPSKEQTKKPRRKSTTSCMMVENNDAPVETVPNAVTRFGRVIKPPSYIQNVFISNQNTTKSAGLELDLPSDKDYYCPFTPPKKLEGATGTEKEADSCEPPPAKRERNIRDEFRCNVCHKIYLGKNRMQRHMETHPEHLLETTLNQALQDYSIYKLLNKKIQQTQGTNEDRVRIFLKEVTDLVDQLRSRAQHLLKSNAGVHFINSRVARVLDIPEGHFGIDIQSLDDENNQLLSQDDELLNVPPPPRLDYNLSLSLDDTLSDAKLHLSDPIPSDDSLFQTVDDLVKEKINDLSGEGVLSVINYDNVNDNAVEAVAIKDTQTPVMLDLSLDLFQFNNN